jgi:hypothetical protein
MEDEVVDDGALLCPKEWYRLEASDAICAAERSHLVDEGAHGWPYFGDLGP